MADTDIDTITSIIAEQLKHDTVTLQAKASLINQKPTTPPTPQHSQRIRFNLIMHCGASNTQTTLQLFQSFAITIRRADPTAIFLPFSATKQHYSSLHNIKQIQEME